MLAALAMIGLLAGGERRYASLASIAQTAYELADKMAAQRYAEANERNG